MIEIKRKSPSEPQKGPQEREEVRAGIPPPSTPKGPSAGKFAANGGVSDPPPDKMEIWREAFRVYEKYAPGIRAAAAQPGGYEEAGRLFSEALERVMWMARAGEDGAIIGMGIYGMLEENWRLHKLQE